MFLTKLRVGVVVLAAALLGSAAGLSALSRVAAAPEERPTRPAAAADGVTVKELWEKVQAASKALQGTWEMQRQLIDGREEERPSFQYCRYTFTDRIGGGPFAAVRIDQKRADGRVDAYEFTFTVNPTTTPAEMTFFSKDGGGILQIYELSGDSLKIAFHGVAELERPRGFTVRDKRVADMPLVVREFKRQAPEKPQPAAADGAGPGAAVKDLTDKSAAAQKDLEGTWELQKTVIDDKEQEFQFEYNRHTFAERMVKIEYKLKRDGEKFEGESSFTVNPTTKPAEMTIYKKDFLVMGIYELNGDTLKIAFHGISELERPRGFAVADKRIADLPLCVWEFKRKKPEGPRPANPPAAKAAKPAWKAEFNKVYGLKDGQSLKLVPAPFPAARDPFYETLQSNVPPERMLLTLRQDGRNVDLHATASRFWDGSRPGGDQPGWPLRKHLEHALRILPQETEGDADLLGTLVDADVVVRKGAAEDRLLKDLQAELRDRYGVRVKFDARQVEREVVIARGKYALKRGPGDEGPTVDVYARETLAEPSATHYSGTEQLLQHLGEFIGRPVIDQTDPASRDVALKHRYHQRRPATAETAAEDTDPEKVLKNVAAQTGLTFTTEKRKVRVLFVEKAGK